MDDGALRGLRIRMKRFSRAVLWGCTLTLVTGGNEGAGYGDLDQHVSVYSLGAQSIGGAKQVLHLHVFTGAVGFFRSSVQKAMDDVVGYCDTALKTEEIG